MKVGSLFAGIGGFDLGFERAGMRISWQVENNEFCQQVLKKHWPSVPCYGDIKAVDWGTVEPVDLICGGFPCQPFSLAGKRRGAEDDRYLWPEVVRCLAVLKPAWGCFENVPGLINMGLDQVLFDLESLGYETGTLCVPACAVDAPHIRQRIWILAHSHGNPLRLQPGRTELRGSGKDEPRHDGKEELMAHAERTERGAVNQARDDHRTDGDAQRAESADRVRGGGEDVAHAIREQSERRHHGIERRERSASQTSRDGRTGRGFENERWSTEPELGRVAHGVPRRVDRLRGLGNAIVPQVAEALGRMILEASK